MEDGCPNPDSSIVMGEVSRWYYTAETSSSFSIISFIGVKPNFS